MSTHFPSATSNRHRLLLVDGIRALASQVIVWHHLVLYGPMARAAWPQADELFGWLQREGRGAVYAFLVVAGYLAARSLLPRPGQAAAIDGPGAFLRRVWRRYLRLAPAYLTALLVAIGVAALARQWMTDPDTPASPGALQLLAHLLLVQDWLGLPALSAGVWYVAIDLQLFACLTGFAWLVHRLGHRRGVSVASLASVLLVLMPVLLGLTLFGRMESLDATPIYFIGAYGLGVVACWCRPADATRDERRRAERIDPDRSAWLAVLMALGAVALLPGLRSQVLVAVAVALLLAWMPGRSRPSPQWLAGWSDRAYSLFVIHYPVCLLANAIFTQALALQPEPPNGSGRAGLALLALVGTWLACNVAATLLYRLVERPAAAASGCGAIAARGQRLWQHPAHRQLPK